MPVSWFGRGTGKVDADESLVQPLAHSIGRRRTAAGRLERRSDRSPERRGRDCRCHRKDIARRPLVFRLSAANDGRPIARTSRTLTRGESRPDIAWFARLYHSRVLLADTRPAQEPVPLADAVPTNKPLITRATS
jgi:hypothetical protein